MLFLHLFWIKCSLSTLGRAPETVSVLFNLYAIACQILCFSQIKGEALTDLILQTASVQTAIKMIG